MALVTIRAESTALANQAALHKTIEIEIYTIELHVGVVKLIWNVVLTNKRVSCW